MDSYVEQFQSAGGSLIMLAKGNRSKEVTNACKKYGGFYLGKITLKNVCIARKNMFEQKLFFFKGSIGGPAAILAKNCIKKVELLEYPELGKN